MFTEYFPRQTRRSLQWRRWRCKHV